MTKTGVAKEQRPKKINVRQGTNELLLYGHMTTSGSKYETRIVRKTITRWRHLDMVICNLVRILATRWRHRELVRQRVVHGNIARWRHQELGIWFINPALDGATKILLQTVTGAENDH